MAQWHADPRGSTLCGAQYKFSSQTVTTILRVIRFARVCVIYVRDDESINPDEKPAIWLRTQTRTAHSVHICRCRAQHRET